ncbi:MAG: class I SAM-dependent methyltransferase [Syntrophobacteraceae bacterium]|jgi:ubiquinone/menaquinone biosynthesis C-methylase UbiE
MHLRPESCGAPIPRGPGFLSIELARRGRYEIVGLDISEAFVRIARENAQEESVDVDFQRGDASAMPFEDDSFDLVVCRAAFKNFTQPAEALDEMFRVLKPGGRAIVIDLRKDASSEEITALIEELNQRWFDSILMKLIFRFMLIPRAYATDQFRKMAAGSKFGGCRITQIPTSCEVVLEK